MTENTENQPQSATERPFIVAISGSRALSELPDREYIFQALDSELGMLIAAGSEVKLHLGDAAGVDQLAWTWAVDRKVEYLVFCASGSSLAWFQRYGFPAVQASDWRSDARGAGLIRNAAMLENAQLLLAFWDGSSPGTRHCRELAAKARIPSRTIVMAPGSGFAHAFLLEDRQPADPLPVQ